MAELKLGFGHAGELQKSSQGLMMVTSQASVSLPGLLKYLGVPVRTKGLINSQRKVCPLPFSLYHTLGTAFTQRNCFSYLQASQSDSFCWF